MTVDGSERPRSAATVTVHAVANIVYDLWDDGYLTNDLEVKPDLLEEAMVHLHDSYDPTTANTIWREIWNAFDGCRRQPRANALQKAL